MVLITRIVFGRLQRRWITKCGEPWWAAVHKSWRIVVDEFWYGALVWRLSNREYLSNRQSLLKWRVYDAELLKTSPNWQKKKDTWFPVQFNKLACSSDPVSRLAEYCSSANRAVKVGAYFRGSPGTAGIANLFWCTDHERKFPLSAGRSSVRIG